MLQRYLALRPSQNGSSTGLRGMIRRPPCQPSACSNCVRPQSVQEHFGHALVEAWLLAADRLTDEGDGREDFPGRNVVARVPAVYRSGEERLERRLEPVQQMLRQVTVGRVTGMQRRGEPTFGADKVREALDPTHERFPRTARGPEHFRSFDALVDLVLQHGDDEVGSAREMPVERSHAHSRKIRNLLRRRVHPAAREHGLCGLHQRDDIPLRVRALTPRRVDTALRRRSRRPGRLGCHGPPVFDNRKEFPYSFGKSFRLMQRTSTDAPTHVMLTSGEPSCSTETSAEQASRSAPTRSARSCSPPGSATPTLRTRSGSSTKRSTRGSTSSTPLTAMKTRRK